jgi:PAS domain S-box-containing protein
MKSIDQEKILKTMIEFAHDGFLLLDSGGIIIQVNQAACSICGFLSADDIRQQPLKFTVLFDLYDFNDNIVPVEQSPVSRALNGEIITDFKGKGIRKDTGKVWHGLFSAIPMFDETKKIVGAVLSIKDISDSVQLVNEREKEKENNRSIIACMVEEAVIAVYDFDIQAGRATVNPEYEIMLGYTPGEIQFTLDWWTNSIHPQERGRARSIMDDCIYGKLQSYKLEFRMRTKSGEWKWILCQGRNVEYDKQGKPIRMLGTHIDITERKRTEEALHDERNKLRKIADTLPGVIFSYHQRPDGSAHLTYASPAYFTILGLNPEEMEKDTTPVFTFIHPDDIGPVKESIAESARTLSSWHREFRYNHPHKGEVWIEGHSVPERDIEGGIIWHGFITDITERKRAQEVMEKMSSILSEGQKIAHLGTFEYITNTQTTVWSEEEYRIFGLDPKEPSPAYDVMLAKNVHHDDAALLDKTFKTAIQSSSVFEFEHRVVRPDGNVRWVFSRAHPYFDRNGKLIRYVGVSLDITERKQMEKKLAEHTRFVESIINMTPDILYIYDIIDNVNVYVNRSLERILGYSEEEIQSMGNRMIPSLMHPDDLIKYRRIIIPKYTQAKDNEPIIHEYRMKHKAGGWRWLASNETIYLRQPDGSPQQIFGLVHDITERKKAEEALQESEYFFKESQRAANIGSYKLNFTTGYWKSSKVLDRIFGIDPNYARNIQGWLDIVHPDDRTMMDEYLREEVISKSNQFTKEYRIIRKSDGIMRWVAGLGRITFDSKGTLISMLGTIQDITERKKAQEKLREESNKLSNIAATVPGVICSFRLNPDGSSQMPYSSPAMLDTSGFTSEEMAKDMSALFTLIHPDDVESVNKSLAESMLNQTPWRKEFRYNHPRKGEAWIETHAMPQREAYGSTIWHGFVTDITARKRAEEALRQSEEKFSKAFMSSPDSITIAQLSDGVFIEINNGSMEIFGYTREELIGHSPLPGDLGIWVNKEDHDRMVSTLNASGEVNAFETFFRHKDKGILNGILSARIIKMDGNNYLLATIHDITKRKHAEEARDRLTRELRALSSCNQALIHAENEQTLLNEICGIVCEVAGYRMTWVGFIVNGESSYLRVVAAAGFEASLITDESFTLTDNGKTPIDTAIRCKISCATSDFTNAPTGTLWSSYALRNGCRSAIALPILDEAGNSLGVLSIYSGEPDVFAAEEIKLLEELAGDLSFGIVSLRTRVERRLAQRALVYEKKLSDALIDASPGIFLVMDRTGRILRMNTNFMKLQGLTRKTFTSQDPLKFVYRDDYDLSKRDIERMVEVGHIEADIRFEFMPGEISWWHMSGHAVTITGTVYLISSGSDITSRKHMEENLQIAIKDKDILLQELYHRTKNNMQVILAYFAMQALALDDEKLQTIFNEMENRIRAMALVHEKLYESKDLTNINLREYLSDLSRLIFKSFPDASDKVTLAFEVEEISVTMDIAIPIGLVVTELLTNSLKYAFPEGRSGKILLRIQKYDRGQLELVISDNGVGVPGTFDFTQKGSIGIPTVLSIVRKQLRGSSELDIAKGFSWKFIFRSDLYSKRV